MGPGHNDGAVSKLDLFVEGFSRQSFYLIRDGISISTGRFSCNQVCSSICGGDCHATEHPSCALAHMAPKASKPCKPGHLICSSCKKEKPENVCKKVRNADPFDNRMEQIRCDDCNCVKSRLFRLEKADKITDEYKGFDGDDRAIFMQKAADLYGSGLAKLVTETEALYASKSTRHKWRETGNAQLLSDVEEMDRFKKYPEQLVALKESTPPWQCPRTKAWMIELPSYERVKEDEELLERSSKRKVEAESHIKAAKKPKAPVDPAGEQKPVGEAQKKRLVKVKEALEKGTLDLNTQLTMAKAPDSKDDVPPKLVQKSDAAKVELDRLHTAITGILDKGTAPKGIVGQTFEDTKEALKSASSFAEQIQGASAMPMPCPEDLRKTRS